MALISENLFHARALVVEANPAMRSVLMAQMRDFGVGNIVQCARIADARRHLENQRFDFVLCELHFPEETETGQDLLDDLQRNQLLPYSTVFLMITSTATYAQVTEAAESALDGYLLKPHKPAQLYERLQKARQRKVALQGIFSAIEAQDLERAAALCIARFESRAAFSQYAARIGAELLLRAGQAVQAKKLYEAVLQADDLPWARLGVARAQLEGGQFSAAIGTLEKLIAQDAGFAEAYDVMGRALFELGRFEEALATCKQSLALTPASVARLQCVGAMAFYAGLLDEAQSALRRACLLGMDSKTFDYQSLVLMALVDCQRGDHKALQRCAQDAERLAIKNADAVRPRQLAQVVNTLNLVQHHHTAQALAAVREMAQDIRQPAFEFEAAFNLVGLLAQLGQHATPADEAHSVIEQLSLRFCSSRSMSEVLVAAARAHTPYAELVRKANATVTRYAENAMALTLQDNPAGTVRELLLRNQETLNTKLLDSAEMVLRRYAEKISDAGLLQDRLQALRAQCTSGQEASQGPRKAGALSLRMRAAPAAKKPAAAEPQPASGTMSMAPQGHSAAQMPQPLQ